MGNLAININELPEIDSKSKVICYHSKIGSSLESFISHRKSALVVPGFFWIPTETLSKLINDPSVYFIPTLEDYLILQNACSDLIAVSKNFITKLPQNDEEENARFVSRIEIIKNLLNSKRLSVGFQCNFNERKRLITGVNELGIKIIRNELISLQVDVVVFIYAYGLKKHHQFFAELENLINSIKPTSSVIINSSIV